MNTREQSTPPETPYKRIKRLSPEGNWTDVAAQMLTDPTEIEEYLKEAIAEYFHEGVPTSGHTPESWVESIRRVINGPNIKTPEKKAIWEKALQEATKESDYFSG